MTEEQNEKEIIEQEFLVKIKVPYGWAIHDQDIIYAIYRAIREDMKPRELRNFVEVESCQIEYQEML
jgi:hypothetical protein